MSRESREEFVIRRPNGDAMQYVAVTSKLSDDSSGLTWTHCQRCAKRFTSAVAHPLAHAIGPNVRVIRVRVKREREDE